MDTLVTVKQTKLEKEMMRRGSEDVVDNFYLTFPQTQLTDPVKSETLKKKISSRLSSFKSKKKSPIDFNVAADTSKVNVDFAQCKSVIVNQTCMFTVEVKDPNNNTSSKDERDVKAIITSPSGNHLVPKVTSNDFVGNWRVEYMANEIGEYYVDLFYANQLVTGSPFKTNVFDPSKIKIVQCLFGVVEEIVKFEVDASKAGTGQLEIAVDNGRIPCNFTSQGNLKFIPSFTPRDAGKHQVSIKFNNHEVPESPFICNVIDLSRVTVASYDQQQNVSVTATSPLLLPIFKTNFVEISLDEAFSHQLNVRLNTPGGSLLPLSRTTTSRNTVKVGFVANEIGTHRLEVDYANTAINGSPFEVKIYDASRIVVSELTSAHLNKQCEFTIDASSAGEGQLEIAINDGLIKNNVKQIKPGNYLVSFVPIKAEPYVIDVKFNNELVPGCPKKVIIKEIHTARLVGKWPDTVLLNEETCFTLEDVRSLADLEIKIRSPSSGHDDVIPNLHKNTSSVDEYSVRWIPRELGAYSVCVSYGEQTVKDTPLKVIVFDPKRVRVSSMPEALVNKPCMFLVDASEAGEGSLEIGITTLAGHFIANQVKPIGYSKFQVHFTPTSALTHLANISFNGHAISDSPYQIRVVDSSLVKAHGKGLGAIPVHVPTSFQVFTSALYATASASAFSSKSRFEEQVRATVTGPKGESVPVKLSEQTSGDFVGEFTPICVGEHRVDILYATQPVSGSPFLAQVYDPSACEIKNMPRELQINAENAFELDMSRVGSGSGGVEFTAKVVSPAGVSLPVSFETLDGNNNRKRVSFTPTELGPHKLQLQLAGQHLTGTPLILVCVEPRFPVLRGEGLHHAIEDKPAYFFIDPQGMKGSIEVNIEGPHHYTKNQIERQADGTYLVKYTPVECGLFKILIKWNQRPVPASPYAATVINPEKVRLLEKLPDNGLLSLKLFEERQLVFDVSEAGPGTLTALITAPNGTKLPFRLAQNQTDHTSTLAFTAIYEGEYKLQMFYENHSIANMPLIARTQLPVDLSKVQVHGLGLREAKIGQEYEFVIDGSRAGNLGSDKPEVNMTGTRCDIDVRMVQLGHNIFKCTYVPQVPGAYLLSIKWNKQQLAEAPYKVTVGMNTDPAKVMVSGEGIKSAVYGQEIKAVIDTRRAGPGELTAHCMGPLKVAYCEFFDHKDGTFTLYVRPQEPGKHLLQIKYNDEHVPGSPFVIRIAGPPDATKVKVFGPGICHGVLNKYESRFICETKGAGAGQLTVRIRGPKGAFRVEMQRESQKDRTIYCKFDPTEHGHYQINIKWSGVHVPGSPFNVNVFNSQEELDNFIKTNPEVAYSIQQNCHV